MVIFVKGSSKCQQVLQNSTKCKLIDIVITITITSSSSSSSLHLHHHHHVCMCVFALKSKCCIQARCHPQRLHSTTRHGDGQGQTGATDGKGHTMPLQNTGVTTWGFSARGGTDNFVTQPLLNH